MLPTAAPKPSKRMPKPKKELKRSSPVARSTPVKKTNPERQARVKKMRAKELRSPENKAAKQLAWDRCQKVCECGCQRPFEYDDGPKGAGWPEFHHVRYNPPVGDYLRRECHHRIEMRDFSYRRHGK